MPLLPYKEIAPDVALMPWAEAFWQCPIKRDGTLRLLPSANIQLLAYSNVHGRGLAIIGPMSKFQMTNVYAGDSFFGARLTIGTRLTITNFDTALIKDGRVFGSELTCPPIEAFEVAFKKAVGPATAHLDLLVQLVRALIQQEYLTRDPLIDRFIVQARAAEGSDPLGGLGTNIPLSERQLRRRFITYTGMPPKTFLKICRQQAALKMLKQSAGTIAAVAAAYGYSDQAHFGNEFRELIGVTPLALDDELTLK